MKTPGTFDCEFGFSCMGYEIAGAWGAKMADESRDVLCFIGDGSYLMMNSDIYSTVLTGHKLIVVLCDNGGFAVINRLQNFKGVPSFNNQIEDCKIVNKVDVDFAAHAASMGALYPHGREPDRPRRCDPLGEDERPHDRSGGEDRRLHLDAGRRLVGRRRAGGFHPRVGQEGAERPRRRTEEAAGWRIAAATFTPTRSRLQRIPWRAKTVASGSPAASSARTVFSALAFSSDSSIARPASASGMTITPSTSPKIQSPGTDWYAAAFDRHVDRPHLAPPFAVERSYGAGEDRKAHLADQADVANEPVRHAARGTTRARRRCEQLAPGRDPVLARARHDGDIVGIEAVDQRDLQLVGIVPGLHVVDRRIECGAHATEQDERIVERSDPRVQRLVPIAERIENIRDNAGIELGPRRRDHCFVHHPPSPRDFRPDAWPEDSRNPVVSRTADCLDPVFPATPE